MSRAEWVEKEHSNELMSPGAKKEKVAVTGPTQMVCSQCLKVSFNGIF